ncbi:type I-E CRISPR-associated protein Cas6/Cse3/CasE [Leeia sp.]|uniref:type I-E CRISPR-associated protein Cas6/Cse3/CasE n=1 Tax=Leeia sp. TaxID=2884678 RepID=UPI0035B1C9C9
MSDYFFSRVIIPPQALAQLPPLSGTGDAYRDHQLVWKLFPEHTAPARFRFRAEPDPQQLGLRYYLVSPQRPLAWHDSIHIDSKPYQPELAVGETVRFSLRANPALTVSRPREPGMVRRPHGQRHDVLMHAKRSGQTAGLAGQALQQHIDLAARGWILQRLAQWGLQIDTPEADDDLPGLADSLPVIQLSRYQQHQLRNKEKHIQFSSIDYQGLAKVTDSGKLRQALLGQPGCGLGHALAFGCGLLLVQRVR